MLAWSGFLVPAYLVSLRKGSLNGCVCAAVVFDPGHVTLHHPLRGVDSVHFQILLMGTCRQCGSWSVAGHNHKKVIGHDPVLAPC